MQNLRKVKFTIDFNGNLEIFVVRLLTNRLVNVVWNFTNVSGHSSQQTTYVKLFELPQRLQKVNTLDPASDGKKIQR